MYNHVYMYTTVSSPLPKDALLEWRASSSAAFLQSLINSIPATATHDARCFSIGFKVKGQVKG